MMKNKRENITLVTQFTGQTFEKQFKQKRTKERTPLIYSTSSLTKT